MSDFNDLLAEADEHILEAMAEPVLIVGTGESISGLFELSMERVQLLRGGHRGMTSVDMDVDTPMLELQQPQADLLAGSELLEIRGMRYRVMSKRPADGGLVVIVLANDTGAAPQSGVWQ